VDDIPTEFSDVLVLVWKRLAADRPDEASVLLMNYWSRRMDALAEPREGRIALRLFQRLGFSTDAPDAWARLRDPLHVYRIGEAGGVSWTVSVDVIEVHSERIRADVPDAVIPVLEAIVAKSEVLAFITDYGEDEVICRPPGPSFTRRP
jgi:hypothetical protein